MPILLDTGVLYAYYDRDDDWHESSRELLEEERGAIFLPVPVIPEVDYLLSSRLGPKAQATLLQGLVDDYFHLVDLPEAGYRRVAELDEAYADLRLGFVDAAVLAIAEISGLGRIATTDRRHFGAVRLGVPLRLLP